MKSQVIVKEIEDYDRHSREGTLMLKTNLGQEVRCYYQGEKPKTNEVIEGNLVYLEAEFSSLNDVFLSNANSEKRMESVGYWDYSVYGQIVALEDDAAVVDCGEVFVCLHGLTRDEDCIGRWVGFKILRLELEAIENDS